MAVQITCTLLKIKKRYKMIVMSSLPAHKHKVLFLKGIWNGFRLLFTETLLKKMYLLSQALIWLAIISLSLYLLPRI